MNKQSAKEWLVKAWHNLSGAYIFYNANHYTDVTAVEIHYAAEKILKSIQAFHNKKILKTHNLTEIYANINDYLNILPDDLDLLDIISEYHIEEAYPQYDRPLPSKEEIKQVLDFTDALFNEVCSILNIDPQEVKK